MKNIDNTNIETKQERKLEDSNKFYYGKSNTAHFVEENAEKRPKAREIESLDICKLNLNRSELTVIATLNNEIKL